MQIRLVCRRRLLRHQGVIRQPKHPGWKQLLAITILRKRPRLPHQPVNDVAVIDAVVGASPQPHHLLHLLAAVPDFNPLRKYPRFDQFSDQPAVHRVAVPLHGDQTTGVNPYPRPPGALQTPVRQGPEHFHLLRQFLFPSTVELIEQLCQKPLILLHIGEVATTVQHQCLVQRTLEAMMPLLDVSVFIRLAGLYLPPFHAVMPQQCRIAFLEIGQFAEIVNRGRHPVGAMQQRHPAQLPYRILQPLAQCDEAFRITQRAALPVRMRQHEVIQHMLKRLAVDRDSYFRQMREVGLAQLARPVFLREVHFLCRPLRCPPVFHFPL
jgi:hypothetical protein